MHLSRVPRLGAALLTTALLAGVPVLAPTSAAAGDDARTAARAGTPLKVTGSGFGHGHGLSQYGALGAAKKGRSYRQILSFYYPGLRTAKDSRSVEVLLTGDTSPDVVVSARSHLSAKSVGRSNSVKLDKGKARQWRITSKDRGATSVVAWRGGSGGWHTFRTLKGDAQFTAGGDPITLHTPSGTVAYRGSLRSVTPVKGSRDSASDRDTVNVVSLEDYVKGVVPNEVPASWPKHAVRAQAVAARTYAAHERDAAPRSRHYQLCDTSLCQVYGGASSENSLSNAAVAATAHQVLVKRGEPAFTQFSASNGGYTSGGGYGYLPAKKDPYDTAYVNWRTTVTAAQVQRAVVLYGGQTDIGSLRSVKVVDRDGNGRYGGRVRSVRITGSKGRVSVTGDEFRSAAALRSTLFKLG